MRNGVREEGRGDFSQCTRIQFNAQGTQCAEWIIPPQSQISLYRPNSAAATTTNAAATSRTRALFRELSFLPVRARIFIECCALARVHIRCVIRITNERIKETCWDCTRQRYYAGFSHCQLSLKWLHKPIVRTFDIEQNYAIFNTAGEYRDGYYLHRSSSDMN